MSFILEALKKADAERDRGAVPDLHAQGLLPEAAFEAEPASRARPWLWLAAGVVLALAAGAVWQWIASDAAPAGPVAAAPAVAPPIAGPPITAPPAAAPIAAAPVAASAADAGHVARSAAEDAAPAPREARAQTPVHADKAAKVEASRAGVPAAAASAAQHKETARPRVAPEHKDAKAAVPSPPSKASAAPQATPAEHIPLLAELPDDVRRQVPPLKLGGLVYSAAPASRMVLVNGDLQREGSTVAPGLMLERINPKSVVFSLRGRRFEVAL